MRGTISVVVPCYDIEAYLPAFLASVETAAALAEGVQFVFVDDGSPDGAVPLIERWIAAHPQRDAVLVRQPNGGLASARNAGLDVATGEWVTFADPDDMLGADYLAILARFVRGPQADDVALIAARVLIHEDEQDELTDSHPLRLRFRDGTRVVDLAASPEIVHVSANSGLFRREVLARHGLRFDARVRPVWEDGHLTARYLATFARPRLALIAEAVYVYRRRGEGTSLMDGQWNDPAKFTEVPRYGWLDALRAAADGHDGTAPPWIQTMVLYDIMGYFKQERRSPSPTAHTPPAVADAFFAVLAEVMALIELDVLDAFRVNFVQTEIRLVLRGFFEHADAQPSEVALDALDRDRGLVRLHYFYRGDAPDEQFTGDGLPLAPAFTSTRPAAFYGRTLMTERIVWLPADRPLTASLDGHAMALRTGPLAVRPLRLTANAMWTQLAGVRFAARHSRSLGAGLLPRAARARNEVRRQVRLLRDPALHAEAEAGRTIRLARTPLYRHRYRDAWLLMDRDSQAQDNAEHLYRYLRAAQPQVNAWFVLSASSPDWARLADEGFRLIAFGSREHRLALLNARHLLSSQIDNYVTAPLDPQLYGEPGWHYTFLQHGVTKDDLSIWINPKPIALMITATPDEQRAIVDPASPYVWGEREVRLTGFPRHDRLLRLGAAVTAPRLVLVMPTWRRELLGVPVAGGNDRVRRTDFWTSRYAREWTDVLASDALAKAAAGHDAQIVFVPHPNMQDYLADNSLPPHVRVHRFRDVDVQQLLAEAAVLVTDYSSMAFEAAYLHRPVVYFQFDRDTFFNGAHAYRQGSWSYADDGFGPVTTDADAAVAAVADVLAEGPDPLHARRAAQTFPFRDGQCARRTYEAVVDMTRPFGAPR